MATVRALPVLLVAALLSLAIAACFKGGTCGANSCQAPQHCSVVTWECGRS